ncbi:hypothetical protein VIGAN_04336600, partial [Vigna angularis var. angularis]
RCGEQWRWQWHMLWKMLKQESSVNPFSLLFMCYFSQMSLLTLARLPIYTSHLAHHLITPNPTLLLKSSPNCTHCFSVKWKWCRGIDGG